MRRFRRKLDSPVASCEYCENLERYNLDPARAEAGATSDVFWHYETVVYLHLTPRVRVRCRKT
jgi:hypothetical protein